MTRRAEPLDPGASIVASWRTTAQVTSYLVEKLPARFWDVEIPREIPPSNAYAWRNLPLDVGDVLAYFVAHEAHHRGQLVMLARQSGHKLPRAVINDLWQFTRFSKQA